MTKAGSRTRLYFCIDESGSFEKRGELVELVGGFVARGKRPSLKAAEKILRAAHDAAGLLLGPRVHATEIKQGKKVRNPKVGRQKFPPTGSVCPRES